MMTAVYLFIVVIIVVLFLIKKQKIVEFFTNNINEIDVNSIPKYLINLDRRKDRLNLTSKLLNEFGYTNVVRYSAVDGSKINESKLRELVHPNSLAPIYNNKRTAHDQLSKGAVGCYLSMSNVWDIIETSGSDYGIVFEDDTKPSLSQNQVNELLKNAPKDWDIILFGGQYNKKKDNITPHFDKVHQFFCLHAYIINKRAIKKIKPHLKPIKMQIDWVLSELSQKDKLNIYIIKNSNWYQNREVSTTDIQTPMVKGD